MTVCTARCVGLSEDALLHALHAMEKRLCNDRPRFRGDALKGLTMAIREVRAALKATRATPKTIGRAEGHG